MSQELLPTLRQWPAPRLLSLPERYDRYIIWVFLGGRGGGGVDEGELAVKTLPLVFGICDWTV